MVDKHLPLGPAVSPEWFGVQGLVGDPFGYSYLEEADAVASAAIGTQLDGSVNVVLQHPIRRRYWVVQADRLTSLGQTPNPRIVPGGAVVERIYAR